MNSFYWFKFATQEKDFFDILSKYLISHNYSERQKRGFDIESINQKAITGRYIERNDYEESFDDPFGKKISFQRTMYETLNFVFYPNKPHIELHGPVTLKSKLFSHFNKPFPNYASITPIKFSPSKYIGSLENIFDKVDVVYLKTSNILFKSRTLCSSEFKSTVDVRKDSKAYLNGQKFDYISVKAFVTLGKQQDTVEIRESGRISTTYTAHSSGIKLLKTALTKAEENTA